jgi:hypothetical protein
VWLDFAFVSPNFTLRTSDEPPHELDHVLARYAEHFTLPTFLLHTASIAVEGLSCDDGVEDGFYENIFHGFSSAWETASAAMDVTSEVFGIIDVSVRQYYFQEYISPVSPDPELYILYQFKQQTKTAIHSFDDDLKLRLIPTLTEWGSVITELQSLLPNEHDRRGTNHFSFEFFLV